MPRILALDVSSHCGWAFFDAPVGSLAAPKAYGLMELGKTVKECGDFPFSYYLAAKEQADNIFNKVIKNYCTKPTDLIIIEEVNPGRAILSQKMLNNIHCLLLANIYPHFPVVYMTSSSWRRTLGIGLSKEQRKQNARLSSAKSNAKSHNKKLDKKSLGIAGKITKKHVAINWCNANFNLGFKMKDNDVADAVTLGNAYLMGGQTCTGKLERAK